MLLKDGVKYLPYEYDSEEELEKMVVEHHTEIFGKDALFIKPQIWITSIGISSKSDGLLLSLKQKQLFILEVELSQHSLDKHIIPQITKFSIALQQPETKAKLIDTLISIVKEDPYKMALIQAMQISDINQFIADTLQNPPLIVIVIDKKTPALEPICQNLPFKTSVIEFKTYARHNALGVHIHSFDSLNQGPTLPKLLSNILVVFKLVYTRNKNYDEAIKIAAKNLKLGQNSLRAMCTRDIGLTSEQLRKIIVNSKKVKDFLILKFPEFVNEITEELP